MAILIIIPKGYILQNLNGIVHARGVAMMKMPMHVFEMVGLEISC
jgi:hypothetical protein